MALLPDARPAHFITAAHLADAPAFPGIDKTFLIRLEIDPSLGARLGSGWNCGFLVCIYFLDLSRFSCYKSFVTVELPQMRNPILIESLSPDSALRKRVADPVLPMRLERFQTQDSDRVWKFLLSRSGQGAFVPSVSF
jgi:hypothetical protein